MNHLYYGDNLDVLRRYIPDESVDLVYLDPPFNSNANYNVLFAERDGTQAAAQIMAFEDTWRWDDGAARTYEDVVEAGGRVSQAMQAFRTFLGESDMLAYLAMMAPRLVDLRRVLKQTGSLYLHCDPTASHYLKMLLDAVFGPAQFKNEIIWKRTNSRSSSRRWPSIHDVILYYSKSQFRAVEEKAKASLKRSPSLGSRICARLQVRIDATRPSQKKLNPGRIPEGRGGPGVYVMTVTRQGGEVKSFSSEGDTLTDLEASFSPERMSTYLGAVQGDREKALHLYTWNTAISAAFYGPLQGRWHCETPSAARRVLRCGMVRQSSGRTRHGVSRSNCEGENGGGARRAFSWSTPRRSCALFRLLDFVAWFRRSHPPCRPQGKLPDDTLEAGAPRSVSLPPNPDTQAGPQSVEQSANVTESNCPSRADLREALDGGSRAHSRCDGVDCAGDADVDRASQPCFDSSRPLDIRDGRAVLMHGLPARWLPLSTAPCSIGGVAVTPG